jgi:hypothetical protein
MTCESPSLDPLSHLPIFSHFYAGSATFHPVGDLTKLHDIFLSSPDTSPSVGYYESVLYNVKKKSLKKTFADIKI